ncbi:hypothetical protein BCR43DRAFT_489678 [Syncephalastrum racemosum]|uniref:TLC domain-containing protein n=1 Tax=Syncephalastrum racemosum TaxID=13706 RepID=A0A1X2HEP1_SYNRA|nr:hypothetical protein BCR43DRAFT_489678 [Syncephalastrum racemosum]
MLLASALGSAVALLCFFYWSAPKVGWENEKAVSWLLTFACSLVCTIVAIPSVYEFYKSGWRMELLIAQHHAWQAILVGFFMAYLALDLSLGYRYYRQRIHFATGWIHHMLYLTLAFLIFRRHPSFFATASILELPTFILSVGTLFPNWRSDLAFGSSFLILRLGFHTAMILPLKHEHPARALWWLAIAILPLHLYWFTGFIRSQMKKQKKMRIPLTPSSNIVRTAMHSAPCMDVDSLMSS